MLQGIMVLAAEAKSIAAESKSIAAESKSIAAESLAVHCTAPNAARGAVSVRESGVDKNLIENEFHRSSPIKVSIISDF